MNRWLSKSSYVLGLQCPLALWLKIHGIKEPESLELSRIFEQGDEVGELAHKLFPKGIDLYTENYDENLQKTKEALKKKKPLFEAGFLVDNCYARADIIVPAGSEWDLIEVKSSSDVKDYHIHDLSFQKYVLESCGLKIRGCYVIHLNKDYVRKGKLDIKKLFLKENVDAEVKDAAKGLEERIKDMFEIMSLPKKPLPGILLAKIIKDGYHDCIGDNCLNLPDDNIFDLRGLTKIKVDLFKAGVKSIKDIPSTVKLNDKQEIQRECAVKNKVHVDKAILNDFLKQLKYPVSYLDFETFSSAIPLFDGLKPWSNVPFQFSLHVVSKEGASPEHYEFLYRGSSDPRGELLSSLKKVLSPSGSIVAFNASFEKGALEKMAEQFPKHKKWVDSALSRTVDLLVPFRNFGYYNHQQFGSASLKYVLPALTGKSYAGMEISDGMEASIRFFLVTYTKDTRFNRDKVLKDLAEYCGLDTLGMVMIVNKMKTMV